MDDERSGELQIRRLKHHNISYYCYCPLFIFLVCGLSKLEVGSRSWMDAEYKMYVCVYWSSGLAAQFKIIFIN